MCVCVCMCLCDFVYICVCVCVIVCVCVFIFRRTLFCCLVQSQTQGQRGQWTVDNTSTQSFNNHVILFVGSKTLGTYIQSLQRMILVNTMGK